MTPDDHIAEAEKLLSTAGGLELDRQQVMVNAAQVHTDIAQVLRDRDEVVRLRAEVQHLRARLSKAEATISRLTTTNAQKPAPQGLTINRMRDAPEPIDGGSKPTYRPGHVPTNEAVDYPGDDRR